MRNEPRLRVKANWRSSRFSGGQVSGTSCDRPDPVFPREMLSKGNIAPTRTTLRVEVLPTGNVASVKVMKNSGYAAFDNAAIAAVRGTKCRFGEPRSTPLWFETWYEFKLE